MRHTHRRPALLPTALLLAAALAVSLAVPAAGAADSPGVNKSSTSYSDADRKLIQEWAARRADSLAKGHPAEMNAARDAIAAEFRGIGVSPEYRVEISRAVLAALPPALSSGDQTVRATAADVAGSLYVPEAMDKLLGLLSDPSAGVRFAAADALCNLAGLDPSGKYRLGNVDAATTDKVLARVKERAVQEPHPITSIRLFRTLAEINSPKATEASLDALEARLSQHAGNPKLAYGPIEKGLVAAYQPLVAKLDKGPNMKRLVRVAARAYFLAAAQLQTLEKPADAKSRADLPADKAKADLELRVLLADYENLLRLSDQILRGQFPIFSPPGTGMPQDIKESLAFDQYEKISVAAAKWRELLMRPPFEFSSSELAPSAN